MPNGLVQKAKHQLRQSESENNGVGLDSASGVKPRISILNKEFKWTSSASTDIAKTFARIRAEQKKAEQERAVKVTELRKTK